MDELSEKWKALREPFDKKVMGLLPKLICKPCVDKICKQHPKQKCKDCNAYISTAHMHLDYVGHAAVTDRLLSVDPAWSWEPLALDDRGLPALDSKGNLWIRLTVLGVTRIGVGDGKSAKEVIGDALRNAAMRFGVALDLWTRDELESRSTDDSPSKTPRKIPPKVTPPSITDPQLRKIMALFNEGGVTDRETRLQITIETIGREISSSSELTKDEAAKLIDRLERDIAEAPQDGDSQPPTGGQDELQAPTEAQLDAAIAQAATDVPAASETPKPEALSTARKLEISDDISAIGLNNLGNQWFMKKVCGKPFSAITSLQDSQWLKAEKLAKEILETDEIDERYLMRAAA